MLILLTNDDGYSALGINALFDCLKEEHEVIMFAPDRERSAVSNTLTLHEPLRVDKVGENRFKSSGSPADCVLLALHGGFLDRKPDVVISGINNGPNLGTDVVYSGTVAGAIQGCFNDVPSLAVSLANTKNKRFDTAALVTRELLKGFDIWKDIRNPININVPNLAFEDIKGYKVTKLGEIFYNNLIVTKHDPRKRPYYWIGGENPYWKGCENTDFWAVENKFVSITPITMDWTNKENIEILKKMEK